MSPARISATKMVRLLFCKSCTLALSHLDAWRATVLAATTIANIVKSSLGPMGLDKMLVDNIGVRCVRVAGLAATDRTLRL